MKKSETHIIYTPGLGDGYDPIRRLCLRLWSIYGVKVTMVPMRWTSDETYEKKRERVERVVRDLAEEKIVLMGESAGGSMALSLFADYTDGIYGVMTLCGKNTRSDNVAPYIYEKNPAFEDSMLRVESDTKRLQLQDRSRFVSVVPLYDPTVPVPQTLIQGAQKMTFPTIGHITSILAMLTIFAPFIISRAKKLSQ